MINMGLGRKAKREFERILFGNHWIRITVQTMTLNHEGVRTIKNRIISGQVAVDAQADATRTLDITLSDPASSLSINPDSPEDGALFMGQMVRIIYSIAAPLPSRWYDIPVFTGPITGLSRDDLTVSVQAAGKDSLAFSSFWKNKTFKKGQGARNVIMYIINEVLGETRFDVDNKNTRTGSKIIISNDVTPWGLIKRMASGMGLTAFYDARGTLRIRKQSGAVVVRFDDSRLTTRPKFTYDPSTLINSVKVTGGKPKGSKKVVRGSAVAPKKHPLSPWSLRRGGVPRYFTLEIQDEKLKTKAACNRAARVALNKGLGQAINVEFEALVDPRLEEGDTYAISTDDVRMNAKAVQWTIPLDSSGKMSVGVIKRVSSPKRGRRPKKKRRGGKHKRGTQRG